MWKVVICRDVVKGQWNEPFEALVHWEHFWIMAHGDGKAFIHFYNFGDNWELANKLLQRIEACPDFTPEGKLRVWVPIVDTKPIRPKVRSNRYVVANGKLLWWVEVVPRLR